MNHSSGQSAPLRAYGANPDKCIGAGGPAESVLGGELCDEGATEDALPGGLQRGRGIPVRRETPSRMIMTGKSTFQLALCFLLGSLLTVSCGRIGVITTPSATSASDLAPTSSFTPSQTQSPALALTSTASPTLVVPDTGWEQLRPGLERRIINLLGDTGEHFEHLYMLRLEPDYFQFDVAYHPGPQTLQAWQSETRSLIVLNGGYFRQENGASVPNGLTVVGGEVIGSTYGEFAGMFAVTRDGPELRWLAQEPYDPNEPLLAALQSFPVLVKPGGEMGFPEQDEDNRAARRSVVAMDRSRRVLFIVASAGNFTLHTLSAYLVASDLELDIAINLDGGPSSGILLASPMEEVPAYALLPIVIIARDR